MHIKWLRYDLSLEKTDVAFDIVNPAFSFFFSLFSNLPFSKSRVNWTIWDFLVCVHCKRVKQVPCVSTSDKHTGVAVLVLVVSIGTSACPWRLVCKTLVSYNTKQVKIKGVYVALTEIRPSACIVNRLTTYKVFVFEIESCCLTF